MQTHGVTTIFFEGTKPFVLCLLQPNSQRSEISTIIIFLFCQVIILTLNLGWKHLNDFFFLYSLYIVCNLSKTLVTTTYHYTSVRWCGVNRPQLFVTQFSRGVSLNGPSDCGISCLVYLIKMIDIVFHSLYYNLQVKNAEQAFLSDT